MSVSIVPFSPSIARSLVESLEVFPVDFEMGWQWLGYSSKQGCKKKLVNNFEKGVDYVFIQVDVNSTGQGFQSGRPSDNIKLTVDCFKSLGMMAGTEQGRMIRKYFLDCERIVKESIPARSDRLRELELQLALTQAETQKTLAEKSILDTRYLIATTCPEPVQQKIFGYREIVKVEYRDRVSPADLSADELQEKLIEDMAAFIDQVKQEKGIAPKVRDLHQKFQSRKLKDSRGNLVKINSHVIRDTILPKALERVRVSRSH